MFFEKINIYMILFFPFAILLSFGIVLIRHLKPPSVGYFVIFIGLALILMGYSIMLWKEAGWRLQRTNIVCFVLAFLLVIGYMFGAVFSSVRPVSFFSLSTIFLLMNSIIIIYFLFLQNSQIRKSQNTIQQMLLSYVNRNKRKKENDQVDSNQQVKKSQSVKSMKSQGGTFMMEKTLNRSFLEDDDNRLFALNYGDEIDDDDGMFNEQFQITDCVSSYSIDPTNPYFEYTQQFNKVYQNNYESIKTSIYVYLLSFFVMILYFISVALFDNDFIIQGLLVIVTLLVCDSCLFCITRSRFNIGPIGLSIIVLISRLWFCIWMGDYWLMAHIFAYGTFGLTLVAQIVYEYILYILIVM